MAGLRVPGASLAVPGVYRFTLEVRDPIHWVRSDPGGVLRDSRTWTVRVKRA